MRVKVLRVLACLHRRRLALAGLCAVAGFFALIGRFWDPYYGFTKLLQVDESDAAVAIPAMRTAPVFVYRGANGYDGAAYAQIAYDPLLRSPDLERAVGDVPYRARRILGSAAAWVLAAGNPARIATTYAALDIAVWLAFAAFVWRLLPVDDWRSWLAWAGLLFSAGAVHSVRLALTDLPGIALAGAALAIAERKRPWASAGVLAVAALARETSLAVLPGLWRGPWTSPRAWIRNAGQAALAAIPLLAWMAYVWARAGAAPQGLGNFDWPIVGFVQKAEDAVAALWEQPQFIWVDATTVLAFIALTVQAAYLLRRPRWDDLWWRAGIVAVAMMACFGRAVWEGNPGAATRVLLPMSLAFAVLAVRERAGLAWIVAGGLGVASGLIILVQVPADPRELGAGRTAGTAYLVGLESGWYGRESNDRHVWSWSPGEGRLELRTSPTVAARAVDALIGVTAVTARRLAISQGGRALWNGVIGPKLRRIDLVRVQADGPPLVLSTSAPPSAAAGDPRKLGFAVYDPRLEVPRR